MTGLWQSIMRGEKGQALPAVLILLILGGVLIVPALNYASTSLNAGQVVEENVRGGVMPPRPGWSTFCGI